MSILSCLLHNSSNHNRERINHKYVLETRKLWPFYSSVNLHITIDLHAAVYLVTTRLVVEHLLAT